MWSADEGDDPARFLAGLRALRDAVALGYEELAVRAHYPSDVLKEADNGPRLPSLPILVAYVRACGGDVPEWEERWRHLGFEVHTEFELPVRPTGASPAAIAGARAGTSIAPPEAYDSARISAALRGGHQRSGAATARLDTAASQATAVTNGDRHAIDENQTSFQRDGHDGTWEAGGSAVAGRSGWVTTDQRSAASAGLADAGRDETATQDEPTPAVNGASPWFRASPGTPARPDPRSGSGTWADAYGPASSGSSAGTQAGAGTQAWAFGVAVARAPAQPQPAEANRNSRDLAAAESRRAQPPVSQHPRPGRGGLDRARVLAIIILVAVICGVLLLILS